MSMHITVDSKLLKNATIKMVQEFGKSSQTPLFRTIIKKYINDDFEIRKDDTNERYLFKPEKKQRKIIYVNDEIRDKFDEKIENELGVTKRKRSSAIEVCLKYWIDGYFEISKEEFMKNYNN